MIPSPWVALVLALGALRATRLLGWDDFPPVVRARNWATGAYSTRTGSPNALSGLTADDPRYELRYRRPTVAALLACPYCVGFHVSTVVYLAWVFEPRWTLYTLAPFALSSAVGLAARWLDP